MREFKFRAWDNVEDEMLYAGEDVEVMFTLGSEGIECTDVRNISPGGYGVYHPEHLIYMQYTGLKDKNGKEIYEGDIIKDEENFLWEVFYEKDGFLVRCNDLMAEENLREANIHGEAIGNIYENPDLLEDTNEINKP